MILPSRLLGQKIEFKLIVPSAQERCTRSVCVCVCVCVCVSLGEKLFENVNSSKRDRDRRN